jgi:anti-sigma B factor antagonist
MLTDDPPSDPALRRAQALRLLPTAGADGEVVLSVTGEVDSLTAPDLRVAVEAVLADPTCRFLSVDLAGVRFLSSAGLSALVGAWETASARNIGFRLLGWADNRAVRRPFELSGLSVLFGLQNDGPDAG